MSKPEFSISPEQIAALVNPIRLEIYTVLRTDGAMTAKGLAARLQRSEMSLYYHLRLLTAQGLLLTESRPTATKPETAYSVRGRMVVEDIDLAEATNRLAVERNFEAILKAAIREHRNAIEALGNASHDDLSIGRLAVRLSPEHMVELRKRLRELSEWIDDNSAPEGRRCTLTFALLPLVATFSPYDNI